MPRRKKGRDKAPPGEKRNRPKSDGFTLNTRAFTGTKTEHEPRPERVPWRQNRPPHQDRTLEDIIGLDVLHGKENPLKEVKENESESEPEL